MQTEKSLKTTLIFLSIVNMLPAIESNLSVERAQSYGLFAVAFAAGLLAAGLILRYSPLSLSPTAVHFMVLGALVYLAYDIFGPSDEPSDYVMDLAHFLMLLCCCKFFELRTHRDLAVTALIAFLVLIIGAFYNSSLIFPVTIAVDVLVGVRWLIVFQMQSEMNNVRLRVQPSAAAAGTRWSAAEHVPQLAAPRAPYRLIFLYAGGLLMTTVVLFIAVPRGWGQSIFTGIRRAVEPAVTGFTDQVRLGNERISESNAHVMDVQIVKGDRFLGPDELVPHLRGITYEIYRAGAWAHRPLLDAETEDHKAGTLENPSALNEIAARVKPDQIIQQRILLDRVDSGRLFSMYPPLTFGSQNIREVILDRRDLCLEVRARGLTKVHYTVSSARRLPPVALTSLQSRYPQAPKDKTRLTEIPPRIRSLATRLRDQAGGAGAPDWQAKTAQAIMRYLTEGDYAYTLERKPTPRGGDLVEDFLFNQKKGHCEFFASAMTLLCQAADIRARFVAGYAGGEYNPVGGFFQFREKDAHAWVEADIPDKGWVTFDPSPGQDAARRTAGTGILDSGRRWVEYLEFKWSTRVVTFDADSRAELLSRFQEWFKELYSGRDHQRSLGRTIASFLWGPEVLTGPQRFFYWVLVLLCVLFLVLLVRVVWIATFMLREYLPARRSGQPAMVRRPGANFYDRLLNLLENKGHVKPPGLTPREFADQLVQKDASLMELRQVTEWFYETQYGLVPLHRDRVVQVSALLRRLREDASFGQPAPSNSTGSGR